MSYESPITKYVDRFVKDIVEKEDGYLLEEVRRVGFNIDKDELEKALMYDRGQYERGFSDGRMYRPPVVTNADRVRQMTDEELAKWMRNIMSGWCPKRTSLCDGKCEKCTLDWLKREVKDEKSNTQEYLNRWGVAP